MAKDDSSKKVPPLLSPSVNLSIFHYKECQSGDVESSPSDLPTLSLMLRKQEDSDNRAAHWSMSSVSHATERKVNMHQREF